VQIYKKNSCNDHSFRSTRVSWHRISPSSRSTRVSRHRTSPYSRSTRVSRHRISPSSRSTRVSWHQISLKHMWSTVSNFIIAMKLFISYQSNASDARKCNYFKALWTTFLDLPLSRSLLSLKPNILPSHPHPFLKHAHTIVPITCFIITWRRYLQDPTYLSVQRLNTCPIPRKDWVFRAGARDVACVQERRRKGTSCRFLGEAGKNIICTGWAVQRNLRVLVYLLQSDEWITMVSETIRKPPLVHRFSYKVFERWNR